MQNTAAMKPLAERMRAETLAQFIGQDEIVGKNSLLRRAISTDKLGNCIFYGPAGTGKTTLAKIISNMTSSACVTMNAVLAGVADAKKIIDEAYVSFRQQGKRTYLVLDECHRWSKAQSDCLLAPIEQGYIVLIGTTTENPYISLTKAILSRSRVFEFKKIPTQAIFNALKACLTDSRGLKAYRLEVSDEALRHIAYLANGDLRSAYNALELAVISTNPSADGLIHVDIEVARQSIDKKCLAVDDTVYYQQLSAFCKSLRGSDTDAAIYWSQRMLMAGIDPLIIVRRLIAHSAEDVGMADPQALVVAVSALHAIEKIGMPECQIPLTEAIIYVAEASKSNSVVEAIAKAQELVKSTENDAVPAHLQNVHYDGNKTAVYLYPHSYGGWVQQTYLPESIKDEVVYVPLKNGYEGKLVRAKVIKKNKG